MTGKANTADIVLRNGRIYTVDTRRSWAAAVAVRNGRIVAVGSDAEVKALIGKTTTVVDLGGRMAMPGIVDAHNHILLGGQSELFEFRFPANADIPEIAERLRSFAEKTPAGKWIVGGQWGSHLGPRLNTAESFALLDAASLGRAVVLRDDTAHNRWASGEALRRAKVTRDTPNPAKGEIGRDASSGALTGIMIEEAAALVDRALSESGHYTPEMDRAAVARSISVLNSYGVTAFLDAASMESILAALKGLDDAGILTAWSVGAMPAYQPWFMFGKAGEELFALRDQFRSAHVRPDFLKLFLDGVPAPRTAAFHDPYVPDAAHGCCFRGSTTLTVPDLVRWVALGEKLGLSSKIHCAGDAAVSQALDAIDVVRSFNGPTRLLHHIAHASYIRPDDVKRFAELGVVADLSPIIWYPTVILEAHKAVLGEERAQRFWPNRDLLEAGALAAAGSDWPVIPNPDPWNGVEGLVTRQNPWGEYPGETLWPEQAVDLTAAIEIYTINGARAIGLGSVTGSIEVGKSADIIVLDRNLFEIPPHDLADTKVVTAYFQGRPVYERE